MPNINAAYTWEIQTCNSGHCAYSMPLRNQVTQNGITYYDCSSFQWFACKQAGFDVAAANKYSMVQSGYYTEAQAEANKNWPWTTPYMRNALLYLGFQELPITGEWKPGDILVNPNQGAKGHTEMVYQGGNAQGICMGARGSGVSISTIVTTASGGPYTQLFRYGEGGTGEQGGAGFYPSSMYVVAAICGNWWQESGINPGVYEGLHVVPLTDNNVYGGYGFGQWTNSVQYSVYRRTALIEWLRANGYADDSPEGEVAFMYHENYWIPKSHSGGYTTLESFLKSTSTDLASLTAAFLDAWEGIYSDAQFQLRYSNAQRVFDYIREHAQDASITTWAIGNRYLTEQERLNNAVLLYRMISAGGGGGGVKPTYPNWTPKPKPSHRTRASKMPLYMYLRTAYKRQY